MRIMSGKEEKYEKLKKIKEEVVNFKESPFYATRVKPVIGEGSYEAEVMLIGEAPGKNESLQGRPFCGVSGRVLDDLLKSVNLLREEIYITNILKDRPPDNRDPRPEEIKLYVPFLDRQIEAIQPKIIVTLGRFSMNYIMNRYGLAEFIEPISKVHGKSYGANFDYGEVLIVPLYHPAVAVYNRNMTEELKKDFKMIKVLLDKRRT